ncbi:hypothetical protein VPH35_124753 [Triticum aestivum]|uniref:Uncharacterized protein n=1 Tax=Triticum urartu TaxID=4572 RepID=A0A8R7V4Z4_TRIUA
MEVVEEPPLDGVQRRLEPVEQLRRVLVVHEEAVVEVEAVAAGVVHEPEQRLVALGVDGRGAEPERGQHPPHGVRHQLRLGGVRVVLRAGHLHHAAPLALEDVEERLGARAAGRGVADADPVEHEREAGPAVARRLRAEHGVRADDVEVLGEAAQELLPGELLDGEHVGEERAAAEAVDGERAEHGLGGEDGGGQEDHVGLALAEVVRVGVEGRAEVRRGGRVVGAGVRQHRVPLPHQRPRQELPEVAEPHDGDLQARMLVVVVLLPLRFNDAGPVVERLPRSGRGMHGAEAERSSGHGEKAPPPPACRRRPVNGLEVGESRRPAAGGR